MGEAETAALRNAGCGCSCACHNTSHGNGCRGATGDERVDPEFRATACFDCTVTCDD